MCVDFTDFNKACQKNNFPLPKIDQLFISTSEHDLLNFIDAFSRYNQILIFKLDKEHNDFIINQGLYSYKVMPFGLKNTRAIDERLLNNIFKPLIGSSMEVYMENMIIKSKDLTDHMQHLEENFSLLRKYQMKLNLKKCVFGASIRKFLGFIRSHKRIKANLEKIRVIL